MHPNNTRKVNGISLANMVTKNTSPGQIAMSKPAKIPVALSKTMEPNQIVKPTIPLLKMMFSITIDVKPWPNVR